MFETTHKLDFLAAPYQSPPGLEIKGISYVAFIVGTCDGLYYTTDGAYVILAIQNGQPGNGHFEDVMEWFEQSCRRDSKRLIFSRIMNDQFMKHLIEKRGFKLYEKDSVIKQFLRK